MTAPLLVIAAGGTGGHLFPAQALAETMLVRGWRVRLSTDARGARYAGAFPPAVPVEQVPSATFARGGLVAKLAVAPTLARGVWAARARMRADRPDVVVGFGGYPAIPALGAATLMRIPAMIHEQNGVLGRVNQIFAPRVARVACGTWPTELPEGVHGVHTGNPVRAAIRERADAGYIQPGDYPMEILVTGGSQGARILSDMIPPAIADLPREMRRHLRVSHQARAEDVDRVAKFYDEALVEAEVLPFFHDMPRRIVGAQLVIARAGASTIADLTVIGRPAILIPLAAAIRDEQTANARAMVEAGAAVLIPEPRLDIAALTGEIAGILGDPGRALQMALAAKELGLPDAAERLADLVEDVAGRDKGQAA